MLRVQRLGSKARRVAKPARPQVHARHLTGIVETVTAVALGLPLALAAYAAMFYRVSKPNEYLVRTGLGIRDISVSKKGVQWPLQTYKYVNMNPTNFAFELHAMSTEKMEFVLPGVFTIGTLISLF